MSPAASHPCCLERELGDGIRWPQGRIRVLFAARPPRRGKEQERWNNPNGNRIPLETEPIGV